jgi:hypothetical protein
VWRIVICFGWAESVNVRISKPRRKIRELLDRRDRTETAMGFFKMVGVAGMFCLLR